MSYSVIAIIALIIILLLNYEFVFGVHHTKAMTGLQNYRLFLLFTILFLLADLLWGFIYDAKVLVTCYIETNAYFIAMAMTVVTWCFFVVKYLGGSKTFRIFMYVGGLLFLLYAVTTLIINAFPDHHILFAMDEADCEYDPGWARYSWFSAQILLFVLVGTYGFIRAIKANQEKRSHYITIGAFSAMMSIAIVFQILYPLWPCYSIGLLLSLTIFYLFAVSDEKRAFLKTIEESETREQKTQDELEWSKHLTYTDPLTGVLSRHAYVVTEETIDGDIREGKISEFAVIVFDLNNLKKVNDSYGHETGDKYIILSVDLIKEHFPGADIYRFGGDEFVTVLNGYLFERRESMLDSFNKAIEENMSLGGPIVATGMSTFLRGEDNTFRAVFLRADSAMYERKMELKGGPKRRRHKAA